MSAEDDRKRAEFAKIEAQIALLREQQHALRADVGQAPPPAVVKRTVKSRGRAVAIGRDMNNSLAITGNGNVVHRGYQGSSPEEALRAYCEGVVSTCKYVPLRAVDVAVSDATRRPERVDLDAIFVDLDTKTTTRRKVEGGMALRATRSWLQRPLRAIEAVASSRCAVLLGDPGSGKSTLLRYISLCFAAHHLNPKAGWLRRLAGWKRAKTDFLPIEVVLRDFAAVLPPEGQIEPKHLWTFITNRLQGQNLEAAVAMLHTALEEGRALVLFDGLDEIPLPAQLARVRDAVAIFAERYAKSKMLVTCRTLSYQLSACKLAKIPFFELAPFDDEKIHSFIDAWYQELSCRGTHGATETANLVRDLHDAVRRPDLRDLSSNPLLLTVMALVHASDGRLPGARALLYERTVELLLWRWDDHRTRRLRNLLEQAGLSEIALKTVLWELAFNAHTAIQPSKTDGVADIPEWTVVKALAERHPQRSYDWANELVEVMKLRAGLLLERESGVYTFPHRTFQEYLAGAHLSVQRDFAMEAAQLWRGDGRWREPVLLAAGRLVQAGDAGRPIELLGELCGERIDDTDQGWCGVWMAAEVLLEVGVNALRERQSGRDLTERVRGRLVELVRRGKLTPACVIG
jgi:hypothetical protein